MTRETDLTLSREDLYELVWSKPMVELAQDLRLSDVALAKRGRKLGVPVPGRGYWARVASGQEPHRPTLPKRDVPTHDRSLVFAAVEALPPPDMADPASEADSVRSKSKLFLQKQLHPLPNSIDPPVLDNTAGQDTYFQTTRPRPASRKVISLCK